MEHYFSQYRAFFKYILPTRFGSKDKTFIYYYFFWLCNSISINLKYQYWYGELLVELTNDRVIMRKYFIHHWHSNLVYPMYHIHWFLKEEKKLIKGLKWTVHSKRLYIGFCRSLCIAHCEREWVDVRVVSQYNLRTVLYI